MKKKAKRKKSSTNLRSALAGVESLGVNPPVQKDTAIIFRVSATEKDEIRRVAKRLGRSVSAYLLDLHRIARERLDA